MSKNPEKDFGPIADDYAFFEDHATEAEQDAQAYLERLRGMAPAQGVLRMLDFGCGSGILAIAALLLGARQAVGTDIDPQALEASRDNATRNGIDPARFPVYLPADLPAKPAEVVVANILAGPLVSLAPQITSLVAPGGRLALSGILAEQAEEVRAAYADAFDLDPTAEKDGWVRISGVRR